MQFRAVGPELRQDAFDRVQVGADGAVGAHLAVAAGVGHGDGIFVDIEAHVSM